MKKLFIGLLVSLAAMAAIAKNDTLVDETDTWKMYTRPELSLTDIGGHKTTMGSLSVGWMLNDKLSLGPSATTSLSAIDDTKQGDIASYGIWYAGLRAEYTIQSYKLVHASASVLVGGGEVKVKDVNQDNMLVVEPGVNVAVNVWDWVEIGIGASYRFTGGVNVGGYDEKDFQSWNMSVFARFSEF